MSREYDLLSEITERLVRIETKLEAVPELHSTLQKHGDEILKFKTSIKLVKWIGGAVLATVAAIAAVMKTFQ